MQLSNLASGLGGYLTLRRFTVTFADLQAIPTGSGAQSIILTAFPGSIQPVVSPIAGPGIIPPAGVLLGVRVKASTAFSGGALSAMTVSVGKSGSNTFFTSAFDIFAAVSDTNLQETALFKHGQASALQVQVTFTPTSDVVQNATAGSVDVDLLMLNVTTDLVGPPVIP